MARNSKNGRTWTRREFMQCGAGMFMGSAAWPVMAACSGPKAQEKGGGVAADAPKSIEAIDTRFDMLENFHLADVNHHGLYIEMGTPARYKYSMGNWMSGWGSETESNGVSFCHAIDSPGRIFFHLDRAMPLTLMFRMRPEGCRQISVYLNETPLSRVPLSGDDWNDAEISVDAAMTRAGENYLKFVFSKPKKIVQGKPAAFAIESIRICGPEESAIKGSEYSPPKGATLVHAFKAKDSERDAIVLAAPSCVSYYLMLPKSPRLAFGLAAEGGAPEAGVTLRMFVTDAAGGERREVFGKTIAGGRAWQEAGVRLDPWADTLVRLDIETEGTGRLAVGHPVIGTPKRPAAEAAGTGARNLIILLIDTQRADHIGLYGSKNTKTPVLDRFAKEGVTCRRCQAPANWTKPSCGSVLTGLYPDSHLARGESSRLSKSSRMISELLKESGFATGAFIANGYMASEFGFNRGWDKYVNFIRERRPTEAEHVFKESLAWIESAKDKRFMAYIQTIDPHVPYDPPRQDLELYDAKPYDGVVRPRSTGELLEEFKKRRVSFDQRDRERLHALYQGEVTYHDRCLETFLARLKELGLLDDTLIAVCADHGEEFFEHESVGHGHTLYQELLHVPLIFRHPRLVKAGGTIEEAVNLVDIAPTLIESAGLPVPEDMEGSSLVPLFQERPRAGIPASFSSFWSEPDNRNLSWAMRLGDWKMMCKGSVKTYLYDIRKDRFEKQDLDETHPLALRAARTYLGQFLAASDKRRWSGVPKVQHVPKTAEEEKVTIPTDLKEQLRALGYAN